MNFQRYLFLFLRQSWIVLILLAAGLGGAYAWLARQTPHYRSVGVIEVVADQEQVMGNMKGAVETRVNSLDVLNTVVQSLTGNTFLLKVAKNIGATAGMADAEGRVPPEAEAFLAATLNKKLTVQLSRGTRLIQVIAEDTSPESARKLAGAVLDEFMSGVHDYQNGATTNGAALLKPLIEQQRLEVKNIEAKLEAYRDANKNFTFGPKESITDSTLQQYNREYTDAKSRRASVADDLEKLKNIKADDHESFLKIPSVAALPQIAAIVNTINGQETIFATLKERYGPLHPKYITADTELHELHRKKEIEIARAADLIKEQFVDFDNKEKQAETLLKAAEGKYNEYQHVMVPYAELQKSADAARATFADLTQRLKEITLSGTVDKNPYRIQEIPILNNAITSPNPPKTYVMVGIGALLLGIGLVLLIDRLDSSIRTVDEAESEFGLPVLAAVPESSLKDIPLGGTVMTDAPDSPQAEAFRNLRASLSLLGDESKRRIILVTSAIPAEGKTFTSMNLAAALASQGLRTLIIDADLRRPALSAAFMQETERKGENYRGLSDVLSGLIDVKEAIRSTSVHGLSFIPSGRRPPNPSELLAQYELPAFLERLLKDFDRIIIDSAPINAVSDSLTIASHTHAVCLVLAFGKTPRKAFQRALNVLGKTSARIAGIVLNRMPASRGAAYYYYYYGEAYNESSNDQSKKRRT